MSFILDALKKSESDRQRHSGPALFEVKVAPPRGAWPLWAVALAALLVVNLAIVVWMLWPHPAARSADSSTAATSPAAQGPQAAAASTPAPAPPPLSLTAPAASPAAAAAPLPPAAASGAGDTPDDYAPAAEAAAAPARRKPGRGAPPGGGPPR